MTASTQNPTAPTRSLMLSIGGMTCASCAARIERRLKAVPGVVDAAVNFASQKAYIQVDDRLKDFTLLLEEVEGTGYQATPYVPEYRASHPFVEERRAYAWRAALGGLLALPFLAAHLAMAFDRTLPFLTPWVQFFLAFPVYTLVGFPFHRRSLGGLAHGEVTMDTLISLGSTAAFLPSLAVLAGFPGGLYFDAATLILFFTALGRALEAMAKGRANRALELLIDLKPRTAHVMKETAQVDLPVEMVGVGENLCVRPGESIPVDGDVIEGKGRVDESLLTGESVPAEKRPGDPLFAGTLNGTTTLIMKSLAVGKRTALARIVRLVEEAQGSKAKAQRVADQVASVFVPLVILLSLGTFLGVRALSGADAWVALERAVAVLVIACPCALGLAVPIALMAGIGLGAKRGVLIRRASALENSRKMDVVVFDKTGTLTEGKPRLVDLVVMEGFEEEKLLRWGAAVEMGTNHPLAAAILREAMVLDLLLPKAAQVIETPGAGVTGFVEGRQVTIGTKAFIESLEGVEADPRVRANVEAHRQAGQTVSLMAVDKKVAAVLVMEDPPRADSREVVEDLKKLGVRVHLLTGDGELVAQKVAERVGVDEVVANADPLGKKAYVEGLQAKGLKVAMVGDGYNDAAALAQADLGVVLGTGTDVAKEAGDLVLVQGGLGKVVESIHIARSVFSVIRQNLFWAFAYNLAALPLAVAGKVSPALAAAAMALSSLTVVLNALRLFAKRP